MTIEEYDNLKVGDYILWLPHDSRVWVAIVKSKKLYANEVNTICIYANFKQYCINFSFEKVRCHEFKLLTEKEASTYYKLSVFT